MRIEKVEARHTGVNSVTDCSSPASRANKALSTSELSVLTVSRLEFAGVCDKTRCHTGYFEYVLDDHGHILVRWDPSLADQPFTVSCSRKLELPIDTFNPSPRVMNRLVSRIVGPYVYTYNKSSSTVTVTPRRDLDGIGFILKNGKLCEVPINEAIRFRLHDGNGGPRLQKGVKLIEMQVSDEVVAVRASNNIMYLYKPGIKPRKRWVKWRETVGFLKPGAVRFPKDMRDWALGVSTQAKPAQRRGLEFINPWTDLNSYYGKEDNKTAFASTITIGVLFGDGRTIRIWDTGLPPDWHRGFITPDHGNFLGEKIAQAGSTWIIYGHERDGMPGLYSRMYDYEIFGACIGMQHAFANQSIAADRGKMVHDLGEAVREIPLAGWNKIAFPRLGGSAVITDRMSIHCCGEGDDAREIRIEGKNAHGRVGYYFKKINDSWWRFKATPDQCLHGQIIDVGVAKPNKITTKPITRDYDTCLQVTGFKHAPVASVSLLKFHPYQTQAEASILRFTLLSGEVVDVSLRTADAWSPFTRTPDEDEMVGAGCGVAKVLMGSLDIGDAVLSSANTEICDFVRTYLEPYNQVPNLFEVVADQDRVAIKTSGSSGAANPPPWSVICARDANAESLFEKIALDDRLMVNHEMSTQEIVATIDRNIDAQNRIQAQLDKVKRRAASLYRKWRHLGRLWIVVKGMVAVTHMQNRPYVGAVVDLMPRLIAAHSHTLRDARNQAFFPTGYSRALERIALNISLAKDEYLRVRGAKIN